MHLRRATERDLDRRFRKDRLSTKSEEKKRVMVLGTGASCYEFAGFFISGAQRVEYTYTCRVERARGGQDHRHGDVRGTLFGVQDAFARCPLSVS